MSHRKCPQTAIEYVELVDYYDKFMMLRGMEKYVPYIRTLETKRIVQLKQRFARRMIG